MTLYKNVLDDEPNEKERTYRQIMERELELKKKIPEPFNDLFKSVKYLQLEHARNKAQLDILYYELTGVKGRDYTKDCTAFNRDHANERYYKISDQIAEYEEADKYIKTALNLLQKLKGMLKPEQQAAINELYYLSFL